MRLLIVAVLLLATVGETYGRDPKVFIAPRTHVVPSSRKVTFDIYWINSGVRAAAIPAVGRYEFSYLSHGADLGWAGGTQKFSVHPPPDRRIPARSILRDIVTIEITRGAAELIELHAEFQGHRRKFRSNSVILRMPR